MKPILCVIFCVLFLSPVACTVVEEDDFEYEVDPTIGEGNEDPEDDDTGTETDTEIETDSASDSGPISDTSSN